MSRSYEDYLAEKAKHEKEVYDDVRNNPIEVAERLNEALRYLSKGLKADVHVAYSLEKRTKHPEEFADMEDYLDSVNQDVDCKYRLNAKISVKHTDYVTVTMELARSWRIFLDDFSLDSVKASSYDAGDGCLGINLKYSGWAFYRQTAPRYFTKGYDRLRERVVSYSF